MSYTVRDIEQEMRACERYLEIDALEPGLHAKLEKETLRKKTARLQALEAREESVREEVRRCDTPLDKLSFALWNSTVPDQEPTCVRRQPHLQRSVQREEQEAVWDPECLDRDPFVAGGWKKQGFGRRPASAPGFGRATTPCEPGPGQRGQKGTLLWRVSGQANNLRKNQVGTPLLSQNAPLPALCPPCCLPTPADLGRSHFWGFAGGLLHII
eukprot:COSAG01_NODE_6956_length_3418_cov_4.629105_2_plen_213_part_00